jgi:cytochrome b involved in lipid metabolism
MVTHTRKGRLPAPAHLASMSLAALTFFGCALAGEEGKISATDLQGHSTPESCWIQIDQNVYDITDYLAEHKNQHEYDLARWCGKDATSGWLDKDGKAKPHSRKAKNMLPRYRIGSMSP